MQKFMAIFFGVGFRWSLLVNVDRSQRLVFVCIDSGWQEADFRVQCCQSSMGTDAPTVKDFPLRANPTLGYKNVSQRLAF